MQLIFRFFNLPYCLQVTRRFRASHKNASRFFAFVQNGTITEGPVGVLHLSVSIKGYVQIFVIYRFTIFQNLIEHGAYNMPYFRPHFRRLSTECRRVLSLVSETRPKGIIVKTDHVGAPEEQHRER